eukprot:4228245-Prymnesium_polylepis.1
MASEASEASAASVTSVAFVASLLASVASVASVAGGSTPHPQGRSSGAGPVPLLLSAICLVAGMAGKGRETCQLGTWRTEVCAVVRDSCSLCDRCRQCFVEFQ